MSCTLQLTTYPQSSSLSLGLEFIAKAIESPTYTTVTVRGRSIDPKVTQTVDDLVALSNGAIVKVTVKGLPVGINKKFVQRIYPTSGGKATIVLDTEQGMNTDEDYSVVAPLFSICTGAEDLENIHGNTLYVSKSGDNTTAEVGNPHKPWDHPLAARDFANANIGTAYTIVVYAGTYTVSPTDPGADYFGGEQQLNVNDGLVSYFFHPDTTMQWDDGNSRAVFRGRTGNNVQTFVYGYLKIIIDGDTRFIDNRDAISMVHCEVESIDIIINNVAAWGNLDQTSYFYIKAKRLTRTSGIAGIGWESSNLSQAYMFIDINQMELGVTGGIVGYTPENNVSGQIRIERYGDFSMNLITNYWYDVTGDITMTDCSYRFIVDGEMFVDDSTLSSDEFFRRSNGTLTFVNTTMEFHISQGKFLQSFWREFNSNVHDENSGFYFFGVYEITRVDATVFAAFEMKGPQARLNFRGIYRCTQADSPVFNMDAPLSLSMVDVEAFQNGSQPVLEFTSTTPDGSSNLEIRNSYLANTAAGVAVVQSGVAIVINYGALYLNNATSDLNVTYTEFSTPP